MILCQHITDHKLFSETTQKETTQMTLDDCKTLVFRLHNLAERNQLFLFPVGEAEKDNPNKTMQTMSEATEGIVLTLVKEFNFSRITQEHFYHKIAATTRGLGSVQSSIEKINALFETIEIITGPFVKRRKQT